jgi:hypothetical protein
MINNIVVFHYSSRLFALAQSTALTGTALVNRVWPGKVSPMNSLRTIQASRNIDRGTIAIRMMQVINRYENCAEIRLAKLRELDNDR